MDETLQIKTERFKTLAIVQLSGMVARLEIYKLKPHLDQLIEEGKIVSDPGYDQCEFHR